VSRWILYILYGFFIASVSGLPVLAEQAMTNASAIPAETPIDTKTDFSTDVPNNVPLTDAESEEMPALNEPADDDSFFSASTLAFFIAVSPRLFTHSEDALLITDRTFFVPPKSAALILA
jgi:hypothetical protein